MRGVSVGTGCAVSRPQSTPAYGRTGPLQIVHRKSDADPFWPVPGNTGCLSEASFPYSPAVPGQEGSAADDARLHRDPRAHMPVRSGGGGEAAVRAGRKSENSDKH